MASPLFPENVTCVSSSSTIRGRIVRVSDEVSTRGDLTFFNFTLRGHGDTWLSCSAFNLNKRFPLIRALLGQMVEVSKLPIRLNKRKYLRFGKFSGRYEEITTIKPSRSIALHSMGMTTRMMTSLPPPSVMRRGPPNPTQSRRSSARTSAPTHRPSCARKRAPSIPRRTCAPSAPRCSTMKNRFALSRSDTCTRNLSTSRLCRRVFRLRRRYRPPTDFLPEGVLYSTFLSNKSKAITFFCLFFFCFLILLFLSYFKFRWNGIASSHIGIVRCLRINKSNMRLPSLCKIQVFDVEPTRSSQDRSPGRCPKVPPGRNP